MISIEKVCFSFTEPKSGVSLPILQDISMSLGSGRVTAIVGPSGCGKSTLLNIIARVLTPTAGTVSVSFSQRGDTYKVGYVFQSASLIPWRNIRQNMILGGEIAGRERKMLERDADVLAGTYGLEGFGKCYPAQLSGGMQQRVALVRAILAGADVLLLDEPFSNSDYVMRRSLQIDVSKAVDAGSLVAVLVTHDVDEAVMLGDQVVVLTARPARIRACIDIPIPRKSRFLSGRRIDSSLLPYLEEVWSVSEGVEYQSAVKAI